MNNIYTPRIHVFFALFIAFALILVGRLFFIQIVHGDEFAERAANQYTTPTPNTVNRGSIYFKERGGTLVSAATLKAGYTIAINPEKIAQATDPEAARESIYEKISAITSIDRDDFFEKQGYGKPLAIFLKVDKDEMIKRNSQRKFCLGVAGDFPVVTDEDKMKCDEQGGTVGTRPDDGLDKMEMRWNEFMNQTHPVVERYLYEGVAKEVDGLLEVFKVHDEVMNVINSYDQA